MSDILPPKKVVYQDATSLQAKLVVEPLYPGYGTTIGGALRRVLLSSLHGAAITSMKVNGVDHEFSQIPHVKEDMVEIMLNVKKVNVTAHANFDEPLKMHLKATGEKVVTAGDIETPSDLAIANPDHVIATLTDAAADVDIEFTVMRGRGYEPVDQRVDQVNEVGVVAVDAIYSPVVRVGMDTHNVRVDNMTNYDSLMLDIETDGTRTPEEAVNEALEILIGQLQHVQTNATQESEVTEPVQEESSVEEPSEDEAADADAADSGEETTEEEK